MFNLKIYLVGRYSSMGRDDWEWVKMCTFGACVEIPLYG